MLETLDTIDWGALEGGWGSAAEVPVLLRALRSPKPEERTDALSELSTNIVHQGTRYQASASAVPFLLELLGDPTTPDRAALLRLLAALAIGYDDTWLPDRFPVAAYRARAVGGAELLRAAPPMRPDEALGGFRRRAAYLASLGKDADRVKACIDLAVYDAVREGLPAVCPLVNGDAAAASVRIQAAYVLAWFPEQAAATLPALRLAVGDADPAVAATVLVAIGLVGASDEAELAGPMLGDPRATVRWAAAVALASLLGSAAPPGVAEELIAWSDGPHERHSAIPFFRGFLGSYAGRAWAQLAPPRRR